MNRLGMMDADAENSIRMLRELADFLERQEESHHAGER